MKSLSWILFLVLLVTSNAFADEVTTSSRIVFHTQNGIRTLLPIEGLTTENALRQGGRIAEIVAGELQEGVAVLFQENAVLSREVTAFNAQGKIMQAFLKKKFEDLKSRHAIHNAEADRQNAEVNQGCLDQACVDRLNSWGRQLDARKKILEDEADALFAEDKNEVAKSKVGADNLNARVSALKAKMGLAYRQLKMIAEYSQQINKILRTRYSAPWQPAGKHPGYNPDGRYPILDGVIEQIKALSGRGFDTE